MNFAKFLRAPFLQNTPGNYLWKCFNQIFQVCISSIFRRSSVFIVNFEHISHLLLVFLLLTLSKQTLAGISFEITSSNWIKVLMVNTLVTESLTLYFEFLFLFRIKLFLWLTDAFIVLVIPLQNRACRWSFLYF